MPSGPLPHPSASPVRRALMPRGAAGEPGFGLVGMRERVEALGGSLSVQPGAAGGWAILARAPLAPLLALEGAGS